MQAAVQEAQDLVRNAEQQMQTALNDVDGAIKFICDAETRHPNRIDICKAKSTFSNQDQAKILPSVAGNISQAGAKTTFGQPSGHGAFSRPQSASFGQPSALFNPTASQQVGFGRPSGLGQAPTAFGQPSFPGTSFGQPSGIGTQQHQPPSVSGAQPNPFSQQSFSAQTSSIIQPFQRDSSSSTFGQPSVPAFSGSTPSIPVQTAEAQTSLSFAANNSAASGSSNAFNKPTANVPSVFDRNPPQTTSTSFGPVPSSTPIANAGASRRPVAALSGGGQTQRDGQGRLRSWNGREIKYLEDQPCYQDATSGSWQKIWFPDGPPTFTKTEDLPEDAYDQTTEEEYQYLKSSGIFKDNRMPLLPPRREWCNWNM